MDGGERGRRGGRQAGGTEGIRGNTAGRREIGDAGERHYVKATGNPAVSAALRRFSLLLTVERWRVVWYCTKRWRGP